MKKLFLAAVALMTVCAASAQNELIQQFNDGATALQNKQFAEAVTLLDKFLDNAMDSEDPNVLGCVPSAKKYIPVAYMNLGLRAASQKNYDEAVEKLNEAADRAELYGETQTQAKAKAALAKVYQVQGGTAYNNKDYAAAAEIFAKGYAADPRNTDMALNLAMSYCESGDYVKGMEVYENIAAMNPDKYGEAIAKAQEMMELYTNNQVAKMQAANDYDGMIAMAEEMLAKNPASPLAQSVQLQAYNGKQDYAKVIELGEAAAEAQTTPEAQSQMYYLLGAAYNAKEMKPQAIAAFKKVTAGPNAANAKAAVAELSK